MRRYSAYLLSGLVVLMVWALSVFLAEHRPTRVLPAYLIFSLALFLCALGVFRIFVRRDYRRRGRLGSLSILLQLLIWGLFLGFPYLYNPPNWAWFWLREPPLDPVITALAVVLITVGLAVLVVAMARLGLTRSLSLEPAVLEQTALYRVTRNPQIVAFTVAIMGLALLWPSWYALGWVVLFAAIAHMMVLTEEEHLKKIHGQQYVKYCQRVPRYLGFRLP